MSASWDFINTNLVDLTKYTLEQQNVITADFDDILVINAFAGTGKTTTLVGFCEARANARILYLAYNRAIKEEAIKKFSHLPHVKVLTTHGLAYAQYKDSFKKRFEDNGMSLSIMDYADYCDDVDEENRYSYGYIISKLIKDFVYSSFTIDDYIQNLLEEKDIFESKYGFKINYFLSKLEFIWDDIIENEDMPFEHDFYLKLYQLNNPYLTNYNFILLDEAQDANNCVMDIILQQSKSKKVYIGDKFQQIYAWRGAINALEKVKEYGKVKELFLTKSFRCSTQIAEIADVYLQISGAPKHFIGNENVIDDEVKYKDFAVISRSNIQLFEYAAFETGNSKLYFVGGFKSYKFYDLVDLVRLRYKKPNEEVDISNPFFKNFDSFQELKDYAEKANEVDILTKIKVSVSIPSISKELRAIKERVVNKPEDADIILTSAHKSKGLEWDSVLLLKGFINLAENEPTQEEINLLYVALTRAKKRISSNSIIVTKEKGIIEVKKEQKEI
jgi:superfamily I DNA/RNA helicase